MHQVTCPGPIGVGAGPGPARSARPHRPPPGLHRFVRGTCKKTDGTCPFSHQVSKEKVSSSWARVFLAGRPAVLPGPAPPPANLQGVHLPHGGSPPARCHTPGRWPQVPVLCGAQSWGGRAAAGDAGHGGLLSPGPSGAPPVTQTLQGQRQGRSAEVSVSAGRGAPRPPPPPPGTRGGAAAGRGGGTGRCRHSASP